MPERSALILAPESPYPMAGGGALRTASLLNYLAQTHEVDLLVFRQPDAPDPSALAASGPGAPRSWCSILPVHRRGKAARALRNAARMARQAPPLIDRFSGFSRRYRRRTLGPPLRSRTRSEHFWCAPYWDQLAPACRRTVLDLHNIESVLHARCAGGGRPAAGFAHRVFRQAVARPGTRLAAALFRRCSPPPRPTPHAARAIAPRRRLASIPMPFPGRPCRRPPRWSQDAGGLFRQHGIPSRTFGAVRFFRAEVWPRAARRWPHLVVAAGGQESRGHAAAAPPATRASKSPARWTTPFANWRAPASPWCPCWRAAARASRSSKPGPPACRWFRPPWARRASGARRRDAAAGG